MQLDEECKGCLMGSQMKKVEKERGRDERFSAFKKGVKEICFSSPKEYCAPLLMRDINSLHKKIFGEDIDYSREKKIFNGLMLKLENELYSLAKKSFDPIYEGLKTAMTANYIDFARASDLNESAVDLVLENAKKALPDKKTVESFKNRLSAARTLCVLHDNCGEVVADKILIRLIKDEFPQISVISVVRGKPIINDTTEEDALFVGLDKIARVVSNGTDIPGTYLKEISPEARKALSESDIILSKGLGNLETLFGEGYEHAFYSFTCKCEHIARRFSAKVGQSVFVEEENI